MAQYNSFKISFKIVLIVVLRLSSNMIGNSDNEINFLHKLLSTNRQVGNNSSTDIKLSKTQLSRMIQSEGFFGRLLSPLLKVGLPLMKNLIKPLAKSFLIPLGLTVAASAADAGIHKKIFRIWNNNTDNIK